ncbi:MAG: hypothetical protein KDN22_12445 [Verrucomicrobiae bacterium]|nr:hypothetical protein [Verrucomicrobiae bacterium]
MESALAAIAELNLLEPAQARIDRIGRCIFKVNHPLATRNRTAQRTGKTTEWDAEAMKIKGHPELDSLIKEPARDGWAYGENLG